MLKKIISAAMVLFTALALCACKDDKPAAQIEEKIWVGTYVYTNDETGEFKVLSVTDEDETGVSMTFESVRSSDEFTAPFKSSSGKYAVLNAGDRCLKFSLQSSNTVVRVDDMWTSDTRRNENWSGKYVMLKEGETVDKFGDKNWNGEYVCADTGVEIGVWAVREGVVLITYKDPADEKDPTVNIRCFRSESNKDEAISIISGRTVKATLKKANSKIEITDDAADGSLNISGVYGAK